MSSLPLGSISLGAGDETISCVTVQRVVSARSVQLTGGGDEHCATWRAHDVVATEGQVTNHPRPQSRPAAHQSQSLLSVYRI